MVVDSARMPAEKSSGRSAMQRIFGVKAAGVRVTGVMAFTSVGDASGLPSADWGAGISKKALSAREGRRDSAGRRWWYKVARGLSSYSNAMSIHLKQIVARMFVTTKLPPTCIRRSKGVDVFS